MKILILGSGGREHTFAWKIAQSPRCSELFIAPGNAGTRDLGTNVPLNPNAFPEVATFALEEEIDIILVGPEDPLVNGIYDYFQSHDELQNIKVFGPSRSGALLEGSKAHAKEFMGRHQIPTAAYREFSIEQLEEGLAYIDLQPTPIVLKADGLAAGKGVLILEERANAKEEFKAMLDGKFGEAGHKVIVEGFLDGIEFSVFAVTDGQTYQLLPIAKDYKRIGEGDTGLNTGGMGAVSPVPFVDEELLSKVKQRIIEPTISGIQEEDMDYLGFVFFGLMNVQGDPYVIEYNCRMGDPETEVVLPRLRTDLVELMEATLRGNLHQLEVEFDDRSAATVILVSGGYPGAYEKGHVIHDLGNLKTSLVFHAGTTDQGDAVMTSGGRVLALTSLADSIPEALAVSYANASKVRFEKMYYRRDIGFDL